MREFRLVKVTKASGFKLWVVQKKVFWWWDYVDAYMDEEKARTTLGNLRGGAPIETREVVQ